MEKKLYRDEHHKVLGGVCAGLADYFGVDVSIIRVLFVLSMVLKGVGFLPYIVLWIVLPRRTNYNFNDPGFKPGVTPGYNPNFNNPNYNNPYSTPHVDYTVPPITPGQPFIPVPPKTSSNVGLIFGVVLIVLGSVFLLDEFDFIPELDFEKVWPVILVAVGAVLIFTGQKKQPWEKEGWNTKANDSTVNADAPGHDKSAYEADKKDDQTGSNPPII
jgi:phage shock protein C